MTDTCTDCGKPLGQTADLCFECGGETETDHEAAREKAGKLWQRILGER